MNKKTFTQIVCLGLALLVSQHVADTVAVHTVDFHYSDALKNPL